MTNGGMNIYMKIGIIVFSACAIAGITDGVIGLADSLKTATYAEMAFSLFIALIMFSFILIMFGMMKESSDAYKETENR